LPLGPFILGAATLHGHPAAKDLGRDNPKPGGNPRITDLKTSSVSSVR